MLGSLKERSEHEISKTYATVKVVDFCFCIDSTTTTKNCSSYINNSKYNNISNSNTYNIINYSNKITTATTVSATTVTTVTSTAATTVASTTTTTRSTTKILRQSGVKRGWLFFRQLGTKRQQTKM